MAREIEFVCVNSDFPEATSRKSQQRLLDALRAVRGILVYRQDFSDSSHTEVSMAVVVLGRPVAPIARQVQSIAQIIGVPVDVTGELSEQKLAQILASRLPNLLDWCETVWTEPPGKCWRCTGGSRG
jgi:hypothetical protein